MNHVCCRTSVDKKTLNVFNKQLKTKDEDCSLVNRLSADCKCINHHRKTDGQPKMKRLKSRSERGLMRGGGKEAKKCKSHHHHCRHQTSKDTALFYEGCRSSCHCPSNKGAPFPKVLPVAQEPSIITDSRLIGHQGLFNHEVKSIDIERLISEQRKLEKSGPQVQEKNNETSHPSSTSLIPSPFSTSDVLAADTDEVVPFENKADLVTKAHSDSCEKETEISRGSDLTPGQRPRQKRDLSCGSFKSISSKHSSQDVEVIRSWTTTNAALSETSRQPQQTPSGDRENVKTLNKKVKGHMITTLDHTPENQESLAIQTQGLGLSPGPLHPSSLHTADHFDIQDRGPESGHVSQSFSAVAASLIDCLQFPRLKKRNLVAESRDVLLKALRDRHGPQLQENLLDLQQRLSFCRDPVQEVQHQEPAMMDKDELLPIDVFRDNTDPQPHFDTTSVKIRRSRHFNRKSSQQLNHHRKQPAGLLTSPVKTSVSLLDEILRPTYSPPFRMDFEPSAVTYGDFLSAPSSTTFNEFNRPDSKEAFMFGSFENSFHTRAVTERHNKTSVRPFFSEGYQAQLPDIVSAAPMHHPQEQDPFQTDRYSFVPSFSAQTHHPQRHSYLPSFSQYSHPSSHLPHMSHHTDMMHFPPSHMLDRDSAPLFPSLLSPEHWSFPPMRLY